ncbi:hypothetical protein POM88_019901 [Heracleum sosnowskyi]|uniref:DUF4220 domain-containing protein n=1 Tax=Heracleum sosnowskyi TaxID=360622 RepID=A0AAD8IBT8_9APIA|nr:hypothetical protein POM88_019901 [Heracleum sosnowskyi]
MVRMEMHKILLNEFFDEWEIRVCILLSLYLQIFLIVAGTFRRLASHKWIIILLWLSYLLAEIIAVFGLGLIVSRQSLFAKYCNDGEPDTCYQDHLHIYWAPFLLVHLGGPDTITAFAPEDNELWPRHLFYLASQCIVVAFALFESLKSNHQLRIPTLLIFFCGIVKCFERTAALYFGSANSFLNSMLSKSDMDGCITKKKARLQIKKTRDALNHLQVLQYAYVYFRAFKGLVVDLDLSIHERNQSREFFLGTSCKEAFWLVEVELNYIYDVLYTKLPLLHHKFSSFCRALSFMAVVVSLVLFHHVAKRENYSRLDLAITYILLTGAVGLDVIAFFMLIFCDWTVVKLKPLSDDSANDNSWKDKFVKLILFVNINKSLFLDWLLRFVGDKHHHPEPKFTDSRWADSLSKFNLILYCLQRPSKGREKFYSCFGLTNFVNWICYVKPQPLTHHMTGFIFDELKIKSELAKSLDIAKQICSSKGEWVLEKNESLGNFLPFVKEYNYDDILLIWHIATELCYNDGQDLVTNKDQRETAKQLSDYMLYLMVMKPDMMSAVCGIGQIKFRNICTEVSKLFDTGEPLLLRRRKFSLFNRQSQKKEVVLKACERIRSFNRESEAVTVKMDRNILFTASLLAKKLKEVSPETKWLIISKLWVELLSYAASNIRSSAHAVQLSKGGELITIVWLLMAHFGLGKEYEINPEKQGAAT